MRGLEMRVTPVLRVARAIVGEGHDLVGRRAGGRRRPTAGVSRRCSRRGGRRNRGLPGRDAHTPCRSLIPSAGRRRRRTSTAARASWLGERSGAADRAPVGADAKLIPVPRIRREPADRDADRMGGGRVRHDHAALHDIAHAGIAGDRHLTWIGFPAIPPPSASPVANRVHSTVLWCVGSPEATPSAKGDGVR